jgi:hypothetical protein
VIDRGRAARRGKGVSAGGSIQCGGDRCVLVHGHRGSAAWSAQRWAVQYWTSRGIAVLDVNYHGQHEVRPPTGINCSAGATSLFFQV